MSAPNEIRKVDTLAQVGEPLEHVTLICDFLLTTLFKHERALLHAEHRRPAHEVTWYVRPRTEHSEGEDEAVAVLPPDILQAFAARLSVFLGIPHWQAGYSRVVLSQAGRQHECRVFLSNCRATGYWVRVYARAV